MDEGILIKGRKFTQEPSWIKTLFSIDVTGATPPPYLQKSEISSYLIEIGHHQFLFLFTALQTFISSYIDSIHEFESHCFMYT